MFLHIQIQPHLLGFVYQKLLLRLRVAGGTSVPLLCKAEESKHCNCVWSHSETGSAGAQTVIWVCCSPCPFISASPSVSEYMLSSKAHRAADRSPRQIGSHRLFVSAQAIEIPGESPLLAGAGKLDIASQAHRALNGILTRKLSEAMQVLQTQFLCYCL